MFQFTTWSSVHTPYSFAVKPNSSSCGANTKTNLLLLLFLSASGFLRSGQFFPECRWESAFSDGATGPDRLQSHLIPTGQTRFSRFHFIYRTTTECQTGLEYRLARRSVRPRETHQLQVYIVPENRRLLSVCGRLGWAYAD